VNKITTNNQASVTSNSSFVSIADAGVVTVGQITAQLPLLDALPDKKARKAAGNVAKKSAAAVVPSILALAVQNGGQVAGVSIDVPSIQESLLEVDAAEKLSTVLRTLLQRLDDDTLQKRAAAAGIATTTVMAMRAAVRTPSGMALRPNLAELTAEMRRLRKPRKPGVSKKKAAAAAGASGTAGGAASAGAAPTAAPGIAVQIGAPPLAVVPAPAK
jgi:hypothetical protein